MSPLADAAGGEKDETAEPCSVYHTEHVCVELREHSMAAVRRAGALAMYALGKDNCFLLQAPATVKRSIHFWPLL